jgi:hypothetical protein
MFWYHPSAQDDKREPAFGRNNKSAILFLFFLKKNQRKMWGIKKHDKK